MALKKAIERNGGIPPQVIVTDNGSTFVNLKGKRLTTFQQACSQLGIRHQRIPFGHPQSIGRIEHFHRTLREEEISLHLYSNPEEARQCIKAAIERYSTEGRENEIKARREELFSSIKRNGRKPKVLTSV